MIRIWFKDINWIDNKGNIIPMSYDKELIVPRRLIHVYQQPISTEDSWGGKSFSVQKTIFDRYRIQFAVKELSIDIIAKLQCCKKIWVREYETNEIIEVDTETSGQITIEDLGRNESVETGFAFNFSSKKTNIYPGIARLNTNNISITIGATTYTYYTDFEILNLVIDPEMVQYDDDSGKKYTSKIIQKIGKRAVFYLMETDAFLLKQQIEIAEPANIKLNTIYVANEAIKCKLTEMTEGLYKCEIELITSSIPYYYA
jgi:hypothetical protein